MQNDINEHLEAIRCALIRNEELQKSHKNGIDRILSSTDLHNRQIIDAINQAKAKRDGNGRFVAKKDN